jgi:S1-C subfamily serine protease
MRGIQMRKYVSGILAFMILSLAIVSAFMDWNYRFNTEIIERDSAFLLVTNSQGHTGSAVYIGNGYVLTAYHVLSASDKNLTLTTNSGAEIAAEHLWSAERYDIALFRVAEDVNLDSYTLTCEPLVLHEQLMFVGNPLNITHISVFGTVAGDPIYNATEIWSHLIPVQAPIIPGMSGGAVVDLNGNLRGINVGTMVLNQGFAFSFTGISYIVPGDVICMLLNR